MKFNDNSEIRKFALELIKILEKTGEKNYANELKAWSGEFFTTSSEFLGELKFILEKISKLEILDNDTKKAIHECIKTIDKAFGN